MNTKKNILLVHLYSNGDCLYATAVARQIKKDSPDCKLTWAIAGFCKNIIDNNPYIDDTIEVNEVKKNDVVAFRKYKRKILAEKKSGKWDEIFITQNMDANISLYDGTIRGMIVRSYPDSIQNIQPELRLHDEEKNNVKRFAEKYSLHKFKNVILWEYAPQSGQSNLNFEFVMNVSKKIVELPDTAVILTSANQFSSSEKIIDASELSIRENAALTHYCNLLIGCSSGITWLSTSNAAKQLPMIQLLNPNAPFRNIPSEDFKRYNVSTDHLIELFNFNEQNIVGCVKSFLTEGMNIAQQKFNQQLPQNFTTSRKIIYNLLCYLNFKGIKKHIKIMKSVYGNKAELNKQIFFGFLEFPVKLIRNTFRKKILYRQY
jgi:hypothetical protein